MIRAAVLFLLLLSGPVHADGPPDPAQANEVGKVFFAEGDFEAARSIWVDAFLIARGEDELALATNLGIACFRLGRWSDAYYYFSFARAHEELGHYQIRTHKKMTQAFKPLKQRLAGKTGHLAVRTHPSPNARVCVGEWDVVCRKAPADWYLPPGLHRIQVGWSDESLLTKTVRIKKNKTLRLDLLLPAPRTVLEYKQISAGGHHTCLVSREGVLRCTGDNRYGQLGINSGDWHRHALSTVTDLGMPARQVEAGNSHTCAITEAGTVFCWGEDADGRLGGGLPLRGTAWRPMPVVGLPGEARDLAVGRDHACASLDEGAIYCWGSNDHGQLGIAGEATSSAIALPVDGLKGDEVAALTAGYGFTCALMKGGEVLCWGRSPAGNSRTPIPLEGLPPGVSEISAGDRHLGILAGTRLWLSRRTSALHKVEKIQGVQRIAAASDRTCAVLEDGALRCVQGNKVGPADPYRAGDTTAVDLSLGPDHLCVVLRDGRFRCIGEDGLGQLGR